MSDKMIMLAAGGTGGHLFPAFALAQELQRRGYTIDLITDLRGDKYGADFPARTVHRVPAATLTAKDPVAILNTIVKLGKGTSQAKKILKEVKPAVIVGFGGYPTFPPLLAARLIGIPSVLHEQNAVMGRANRMLAGRVDAIALSFDQTIHVEGALKAKARHTGNPVRDVVIAAAATPYPPLAADTPLHLLVFGGSQGARYFSDLLPPALDRLPAEVKARLRVVQQCREEDMERVGAAYRAAGIVSELSTFFPDLPGIIARSHLVIARSGASSVSELSVIGRPSILVPLPHALDNDQLRNAAFLQRAGGAWCIEQKDLDAERLARELTRLSQDPALLHNAANAAKGVGKPDAVARLGDLVEDVAARRDIAGKTRS